MTIDVPSVGVIGVSSISRGTALDPFGYTAERKMERRLIDEYERLIERVGAGLRPDRLDLAVELAQLPDGVRGFGHVKERHVASVKRREQELLRQWEGGQRRPPA
jgi:indolepyruvate ferredoxin oxidoreductase